MKESPGRDRVLTEEEILRLLTACKESKSPYLYCIVLISLTTGARQGELLNLEWRHVDFDNKLAYLKETKNGRPRSIADELQVLLKKNGYSQPEIITEKLLELYKEQNLELEQDIRKLEESRAANSDANRLFSMLGMIPEIDSADRVLKYERGLQKSIYQNLIMLKKLQGLF